MSTVVSFVYASTLCISLILGPVQERRLPASREDVSATVKEAVRLLDSREYKTVLVDFFPPEFVKKQSTSPAATEKWLEVFSSKSVAFILPKLRSSMSVRPTFDKAGTKAVFRFKTHEGTASLIMVKVGLYWYIEPYQ